MNWGADVRGAHILDYQEAKARKDLFKSGNDGITSLYVDLKWNTIFRCPPPENPMNIIDYFLCSGMHKKWTRHWFGIAREGGPCKVANIEMALFHPLSRTGSATVMFTWSYDPDMNFNLQRQADEFAQSIEEMSKSEVRSMLEKVQQMARTELDKDATEEEQLEYERFNEMALPMLKKKMASFK